MGPEDGLVEVERHLLPGSSSREGADTDEDETILYNASFEDMEENYVKYHTAHWVLYSLLLVVAWGIGLLMLLYIPVLRHVLRKEFRSRRLYVTPNAIVYKVVLTRLHSMRGKRLTGQFGTEEDTTPSSSFAKNDDYLHRQELILQKLKEVGNYVKEVQTLIEKRHYHVSESLV